MKIVFTDHAELKFEILGNHGFRVTKKQVEDTVLKPDKIMEGRKGRLIAQKRIDAEHLLRVVYEKGEDIVIITFYPARRERYED
ncbi:MAG: DUF4258 domain-containing protein [Euryarchaeota archaeon]|nr:DUF4258 domain-containing protein [Euryarchaeota archaeon]